MGYAASEPRSVQGRHRRPITVRPLPAGPSRDGIASCRLRPLTVVWTLAITTGLLLESLLPQSFIPSISTGVLADLTEVRNTPVSYLFLGVGLGLLAFAFDRFDIRGGVRGATMGAIFGTVASMILIGRSIPVQEIGWFPLLAASLLHLVVFGLAGVFLAAYRNA